jgi:hypothetical protein
MTAEEQPTLGQQSVRRIGPRAEGPGGASQDEQEPAFAPEGERPQAAKLSLAAEVGTKRHAVVPDKHLRDLFREFEKKAIHPVIIFGTSKSGKTLMLQSLIYEARTRLAYLLGASLGPSIFPPDYPQSSLRYRNAEDLINDGLRNFRDGSLAKQTGVEEPFFVPVDLNVAHDDGTKETIRFAFLESVGEWLSYKSGELRVFQELHPEISAILNQYTWPMSIIFVAPTKAGNTPTEFDDHCACLAHAMEEYNRLRQSKQGDNLLLLVSKWDALHPPGSALFDNATGADVHRLVANWYPIWTAYAQNILGVRKDAKAFMPYSAAWINDEQTIRRPGPYENTFGHFNKTLWNWLYANARQAAESQADNGAISGKRAVLFPETVLEDATKVQMSWLGQIFTFQPWKR